MLFKMISVRYAKALGYSSKKLNALWWEFTKINCAKEWQCYLFALAVCVVLEHDSLKELRISGKYANAFTKLK